MVGAVRSIKTEDYCQAKSIASTDRNIKQDRVKGKEEANRPEHQDRAKVGEEGREEVREEGNNRSGLGGGEWSTKRKSGSKERMERVPQKWGKKGCDETLQNFGGGEREKEQGGGGRDE